ncbi:NUDIX domain-containing protein [Frigidibacter albus]|uniref:NUDIX domain-containing protein n=2 Tax=Frigidibacter albus TaxID=1465486 RepID=A0A6L8VL08_9RHOB|nr:NUDIX hydrolase [Frigidibacter albus]MZQ90252.1 NUDIX domain-containing protein [Frigidibacter albus]NBE32250.1 NUDIX domain-containing protein [Frigidibacter albus]
MGRRPPRLQVAALCLRERGGVQELLLITSLDTGRWVLPKGWPMRGRSLGGAALREAWEEAGVNGAVAHDPVGHYGYAKRSRAGLARRVKVAVYPVQVRRMEKGYPEEGRRKLAWVTPAVAAAMVKEPELAALLADLPARLEVVNTGGPT